MDENRLNGGMCVACREPIQRIWNDFEVGKRQVGRMDFVIDAFMPLRALLRPLGPLRPSRTLLRPSWAVRPLRALLRPLELVGVDKGLIKALRPLRAILRPLNVSLRPSRA